MMLTALYHRRIHIRDGRVRQMRGHEYRLGYRADLEGLRAMAILLVSLATCVLLTYKAPQLAF